MNKYFSGLVERHGVSIAIIACICLISGAIAISILHPPHIYDAADYAKEAAKCSSANMKVESIVANSRTVGVWCITPDGHRLSPGKDK